MRTRSMMVSILLAIATAALVLLSGVGASAASGAPKSFTARAGGVTATLSYVQTATIDVKNERLRITAPGMPTYDRPVPANGCFKVCDPGNRPLVQVADLYGDGEYLVVLDLWTGGADCCGLEQVYAPSSAVHSWVLSWRNFGNYGAALRKLGGQERFISGDRAFYCTFTDCAASGQPIQVFSFTGEAFHNVTSRYRSLIERDAARWLNAYEKAIRGGDDVGLIAAWAADEDLLGHQALVDSRLASELAAGHLKGPFESGAKFVAHLKRFLGAHGYTGS